MWMETGVDAEAIDLFTDTSGKVGFGAFCNGSWCAGTWPESWVDKGFMRNLALLELFPILVTVVIWGKFVLTVTILAWLTP